MWYTKGRLGRTVQVHRQKEGSGLGATEIRQTTTYDALGRVAKEWVPYEGSHGDEGGYGQYGYVPPAVGLGYTTYQYDALGRTTLVTHPDGTQVEYEHNHHATYGWYTRTWDENDHRTVHFTDPFGRMTRVHEWWGAEEGQYDVTQYLYDVRDNLLQVTDDAGNVSIMSYDPLGRKETMQDPDMGEWGYAYDARGNLIGQLDAKGQLLTLSYDPLGRLTNKLAPDATTTSLYDPFDIKDTATWAWSAHQTVPFPDGDNNVVKSTGTNLNYNAHFYRTSYSLADGQGLQLHFRVSSDNTVAHFSIEAEDATYRRFGAVANEGKLKVQYKMDGVNWVYPADLLSDLETNTWYVLQIGVDDVGGFSLQVYQKDDPSVWGAYRLSTPAGVEGKSWRFHHWIYRNTAYLDEYREFGGPVWRYDEAGYGRSTGKRTRMIDSSGSTAYFYEDGRGRLTRESKVIDGGGTFVTQWSYDALDRVETMTYPGGSGGQSGEVVTTTHNTQGLPATVTGDAAYVDGADYNALGQPELLTFGGAGLDLQIAYDYYGDDQRLKEIWIGTSGWWGRWGRLKYEYDNAGNVTRIYDKRWVGGVQVEQTQTFEYDDRDRLTNAYTGGAGTWGTYNESYAYDAIGNLTSKGGVSYSYPAAGSARPHAVTSTSNGGSFSYDANGNMTSRRLQSGGSTYTQTWDHDNRLATVTVNGQTTTFTYDGNGALVKKEAGGVTTVYVGNHYEKQGSSVVKYYFFNGQRVAMRKEGVVQYLVGDHLGTTSVVLNADGSLHSEARHRPYGEERWSSGTVPTEYRFTGQRLEVGLGIYSMGARWYDSSLARWLSADTLVPDLGDPQALNRYYFVLGNPLRYRDPTGHRENGACGANNEECPDEPPPPPPPPLEEVILQILQGLADTIYDPARMEPIQVTLPDGTLLVIMPMSSSSEIRGSEVCTGIGLGMDILELASIGIPGASDLPAIVDFLVTLGGSVWSGESFVGGAHPSLPPAAAVGQDVLITGGDLLIAAVAKLAGAGLGGPGGYALGMLVDLGTTGFSAAHDYYRLEGSLDSFIKAGITLDGNFTQTILFYPASAPELLRPR